jgi:hypothetical protein
MEEAKLSGFPASDRGRPIKDGEAFQFYGETMSEVKLPEPFGYLTTSLGRFPVFDWTSGHAIFTADQLRQAVLQERERLSGLLSKCAAIAEWHIGDGDECGVLAREVYEAIRKG